MCCLKRSFELFEMPLSLVAVQLRPGVQAPPAHRGHERGAGFSGGLQGRGARGDVSGGEPIRLIIEDAGTNMIQYDPI